MRRAMGSPSFRFATMPSRHISCRRSRSPSGIVRKSEGMVGAQFITFTERGWSLSRAGIQRRNLLG
ncbi:hypothetical protein C8R44DRAFT_814776, partial [Mycena epipterygia]